MEDLSKLSEADYQVIRGRLHFDKIFEKLRHKIHPRHSLLELIWSTLV